MDLRQRSLIDRRLDHRLWYRSLRWQGVPYQHQAASRWGCDCVGLPVAIAKEMGYDFSKYDVDCRPRNAIDDILLDCVKSMSVEQESYRTGSLLLFTIGRHIQHLAIWGKGRNGQSQIVHADRTNGKVVLIDYPRNLEERLEGIYVPDWSKATRCSFVRERDPEKRRPGGYAPPALHESTKELQLAIR
jgi:hypothetical protein